MFPDLTRDDVFRLETRRLWLRWPRAADGPAVVRHAGERAVADMTALIPHPLDPDRAGAFIAAARTANAEGAALHMAVTPRARPSELIGLVALTPNADGRPHLGTWFAIPAWGQGFATEACRALIDAFFAYTGGDEIVSAARVVNPGSRRVLEKCGFAYAGSGLLAFPARGGVLPVDAFRLDRRAWVSLKTWRAASFVIERDPPEQEPAACHA